MFLAHLQCDKLPLGMVSMRMRESKHAWEAAHARHREISIAGHTVVDRSHLSSIITTSYGCHALKDINCHRKINALIIIQANGRMMRISSHKYLAVATRKEI